MTRKEHKIKEHKTKERNGHEQKTTRTLTRTRNTNRER